MLDERELSSLVEWRAIANLSSTIVETTIKMSQREPKYLPKKQKAHTL
ncbi:hypothetical protein [Leptolyngbya sp. FACHB-16]|nr:hypothetical protein [Leptolyngbya sp. FACHB-16]MBD1909377.1 hypothetical protein [Leptolyngbya sp. FACHB-8]MBD2157613.1 hypothetical protein [Leptolyngbya sp. FACHB-16]